MLRNASVIALALQLSATGAAAQPALAGAALAPPADTVWPTGGVEVAQVVQNPENSVPLVGGRAAWARVYLRANRTGSFDVRGRLRVSWADGTDTVLPTLRPARLPGGASKRERWNSSLNFLIPADLMRAGLMTLRLEDVFPPTSGPAVECAGCAATARRVAVGPPVVLYVKAVGFRYTVGGQTILPRAEDFDLLRAWLERGFPASKVVMEQINVDAPMSFPLACQRMNTLLMQLRALDLKGGQDPRTHYYGVMYDGGFNTLMPGCSSGIPELPDPGVVASGPSGKPGGDLDWDEDASYGDWYGAHELAHTFGLRHPGYCRDQETADPLLRKRYPSGRIGTAAEDNLGLLWSGGTADPVLLPRARWRDLMTHCDSIWPSAYADSAILQRLYDEDAAYRKGSWTVSTSTGPGVLNVIARFEGLGTSRPRAQILNVLSVPFRGRSEKVDSLMLARVTPRRRVEVVLLNNRDSVLLRVPSWIQPDALEDTAAVTATGSWAGTVSAYIPDHPAVALIRLVWVDPVRSDTVRAARAVTSSAPRRRGEPRVNRISSGYRFRWESVDPDPSPEGITNYMQFRYDDNPRWTTVDSSRKNDFVVGWDHLRDRQHLWMRIIASDGKNDAVVLQTCDLVVPPLPDAAPEGDVCRP